MEVSKISKPVASTLTVRGRNNFLKTFANDTSAEPIEASVFRSTDEDAKAIHMPIMKLTGGNLSFHAFFDNPRIAGFDFSGEFGQPIPYADNDGVVTDFNWFLTDDILIEDNGSYPDITDDFDDLVANNSYTTGILDFPADLDPQAAFAITYQINPVVESNRFIIGEGFTKYNFLVAVQSLDLKVYFKPTPYTYQDVDLGVEANVSYAFNLAERKMTFTKNVSGKQWITDTSQAAVWQFTIDLGLVSSCSTQTAGLSIIESNHPAVNQSLGDRARIIAQTEVIINDTPFISDCVELRYTISNVGAVNHFALVNNDELIIGFNETLELNVPQDYYLNFLLSLSVDVQVLDLEASFNISSEIDFISYQPLFLESSIKAGSQITITPYEPLFLESSFVSNSLMSFIAYNALILQGGTIASSTLDFDTLFIQVETFNTQAKPIANSQLNFTANPILPPNQIWVTDTSVASVWDVTVNLGLVTTCPTQQSGLSIIENNAPANSQSVGDRGRIVSAQEDNGAFLPCTERRYRVELE